MIEAVLTLLGFMAGIVVTVVAVIIVVRVVSEEVIKRHMW